MQKQVSRAGADEMGVGTGILLLITVDKVSAVPLAASSDPQHLTISGVVLACAAFMLLASAVKGMNLVPFSAYAKVDRVIALMCGSVFGVFFTQRFSVTSQFLSWRLFSQYFIAGGICAFVTHAACTPIDVVKTRIQTTKGIYLGMAHAFRKIIADEGPAMLLKGLGATASGYFLHGAFKYSFYEVFKTLLSENAELALKPPSYIAAFSGFLAECIACLLLCPMEAVRIRSVADLNFPSGVLSGLRVIATNEGFHGLYKGLPAMLLKQVPYTVGQFVSFELSLTVVKSLVELASNVQSVSKGELPPQIVAAISLSAGFLAGIAAAVISHPGDTILSKINQEQSEGSAWGQILRVAQSLGFRGLFIGLVPRLVQVSCMIGGQFLIYDSIKLLCGIKPASAIPSSITAVTAASNSGTASVMQAHIGNSAKAK